MDCTNVDHFCQSPDIVVNGFKAIAQSIDAGDPVLDDDFDGDSSDSDCDSDQDGASAFFSSDEEN